MSFFDTSLDARGKNGEFLKTKMNFRKLLVYKEIRHKEVFRYEKRKQHLQAQRRPMGGALSPHQGQRPDPVRLLLWKNIRGSAQKTKGNGRTHRDGHRNKTHPRQNRRRPVRSVAAAQSAPCQAGFLRQIRVFDQRPYPRRSRTGFHSGTR